MAKRPLLVAEVKTSSPFGFKSDKRWPQLFEIAEKHGDIISIHVDPRWGGNPGNIDGARVNTVKPILAKGLDISLPKAHEYIRRGADHVLVHDQHIQGQFEPGVCWLELPSELDQWPFIRFKPEHTYVVNSRNPRNGLFLGYDSFDYARRLHPHGPIVQASFVRTMQYVQPGADYIIVGQNLPDFVKEWSSAKTADSKGWRSGRNVVIP